MTFEHSHPARPGESASETIRVVSSRIAVRSCMRTVTVWPKRSKATLRRAACTSVSKVRRISSNSGFVITDVNRNLLMSAFSDSLRQGRECPAEGVIA